MYEKLSIFRIWNENESEATGGLELNFFGVYDCSAAMRLIIQKVNKKFCWFSRGANIARNSFIGCEQFSIDW